MRFDDKVLNLNSTYAVATGRDIGAAVNLHLETVDGKVTELELLPHDVASLIVTLTTALSRVGSAQRVARSMGVQEVTDVPSVRAYRYDQT